MGVIASHITSFSIICSTAYSGADQRKKPKLCVTGISEGNPPVTGGSPHKGLVTRNMFPFDDDIGEVDSPHGED